MRKTWGVAVMVLAGVIGCQRVDQPVTDRMISLQSAPDDAAMELRDDWETSVVTYPNGGVVAGPTLYPYTTRDSAAWQQASFEPVLFLGQTIALPVTVFTTPITAQVVYQGVNFPDTDTAVQPLPPSDVELPQPVPDRRHPSAAVSNAAPLQTRERRAQPTSEAPARTVTPERTTPRETAPGDVTPVTPEPRDTVTEPVTRPAATPRAVEEAPSTRPTLNK